MLPFFANHVPSNSVAKISKAVTLTNLPLIHRHPDTSQNLCPPLLICFLRPWSQCLLANPNFHVFAAAIKMYSLKFAEFDAPSASLLLKTVQMFQQTIKWFHTL